MEEEKLGLKEEIVKLSQNFEQMVKKKEVKKFRLPFSAKVGRKRAKDGYTAILYINENRGIKFLKAPIREGTIMVDGVPHLATTDYMLHYKNKPFLIVPSWNTTPFAPSDNMDQAISKKTTTAGYRLLLNTLKSEQIKQKPKISFGIIIVILLAIAAGVYYFTQGGFQ